MSVRHSILAILDQGPCYGYQLRHEFERRTGGSWPLNVGQIYHTLDRLQRDGMVTAAGGDQAGHIFYAITPAGRRQARTWLAEPSARPAAPARDELAIRLALAATLPGVDAVSAVRAQREASEQARSELARAVEAADGPGSPESLAVALVLDARLEAAEAELRWLSRAERRLADPASPQATGGLPLAAHPPKRGRPARGAHPAGSADAAPRGAHHPTGSGLPSS